MSRPLAVITGASAGFGAVFARKLAARGFDLLLAARRRDRLDALAGELSRTHSITAEPCPVDLSTEEGIEIVASRLGAEANVGLLLNNAGFGTKGRFAETAMDGQVRMHRLHIDATLRLTRAVLPGMVERDRGAIINVASVAAFARSPGNVSYCATKAWLAAFTEGLYLELQSVGSKVAVQALCPGFAYTEFHDVMGFQRSKIARSLWMSAEAVVDASLAGLASRKLYVIPGWRYRLFMAIFPRLPVGMRLALEGLSPHRKDK
ncbi:MAG: SDR family oxidoreductase [Acidobacteriia bacterium]|nr:SDR family oxidoreductase [Terriglobia bacterium]